MFYTQTEHCFGETCRGRIPLTGLLNEKSFFSFFFFFLRTALLKLVAQAGSFVNKQQSVC